MSLTAESSCWWSCSEVKLEELHTVREVRSTCHYYLHSLTFTTPSTVQLSRRISTTSTTGALIPASISPARHPRFYFLFGQHRRSFPALRRKRKRRPREPPSAQRPPNLTRPRLGPRTAMLTSHRAPYNVRHATYYAG